MNVNSVVLAGAVAKPPALFYRKDGVAVLRFLLTIADENAKLNKTFKLTLPCELVGDRAEALGVDLEADDVVLVKGWLAYRSTAEQAGGTLGVRCEVAQRLGRVAEVPF
jgi:primosomal replication protein N